MTDYPYMMANNKIAQIIGSIQTAAKPPKFTVEFLKQLGCSSSILNSLQSIPTYTKIRTIISKVLYLV